MIKRYRKSKEYIRPHIPNIECISIMSILFLPKYTYKYSRHLFSNENSVGKSKNVKRLKKTKTDKKKKGFFSRMCVRCKGPVCKLM